MSKYRVFKSYGGRFRVTILRKSKRTIDYTRGWWVEVTD